MGLNITYRDLDFFFGQNIVLVCDPSIVMKDLYEKPCLKCQLRWVVLGGLNPMIFLNHLFHKKIGKVLNFNTFFHIFPPESIFSKLISQNRESSHGKNCWYGLPTLNIIKGPYDIKMVLDENQYKSQGTKPLIEPLAKLNTLLSLAALTLIIYFQKC
jgi:hypothetical protein